MPLALEVDVINLQSLLPDYEQQLPATQVRGLVLDSRRIESGDCFIAVQGHQVDGRHFIEAAIKAGASAVLQQANSFSVDVRGGVPVVSVPQLAEHLSAIAGRFFGSPSSQLKLTGVTGTNGKTTVTHLVAQLFATLGQPAAVIGTLGSGVVSAASDSLTEEQNTTPDAVTLQKRLRELQDDGISQVAMEVSSHALVQGRVAALAFDTVVATNLSRDHLDYHGSMESYAAAKRDLFTRYPARVRIFNADDAIVNSWYEAAPNHYRYTLNEQLLAAQNMLGVSQVSYHSEGAEFQLHWQGEQQKAQSSLLGRFNVANVLAAALVALSAGYELEAVAASIGKLKAVAGRMEQFSAPGEPLVIVDYAHTPDALTQVLQAARLHCRGQLWCVFGCGGDRDRGKRPQMGQAASEAADIIVITDDNPRTENPQQIIADIASGATEGARVLTHSGRRKAVLNTLRDASAEDVVVLAGKGHEDYQVVGTQKIDYNERQVVASFMEDATHA
ncbi:UDP-N-acetylmuramoyl-L-alanyl-D-glutamate--2,6-diaminopimelate ligase [Aliidiomarina sp. Khilg15.8]